jgi:hypothetical protein
LIHIQQSENPQKRPRRGLGDDVEAVFGRRVFRKIRNPMIDDTAVYAAAGLLYVSMVVSMSRPIPPAMKLVWILTIAGPAFVIAGMFLAGWLKRGQLRSTSQ